MTEVVGREAAATAEVEPGTVSFEGRSFTIPSFGLAVNKEERLALAYITADAVRFKGDVVEHSFDLGAVDLSLVRTGRCPLLADHLTILEALIGQVLTAEIEGGVMRCLVRFARTRQADELWTMVADGFPLSVSLGGEVTHAIMTDDGRCRITAWQLRELSIVTYGKDQSARISRLGPDVDAAAMVARMNPPGDDPGRAAIRELLRLPEWKRWARLTGCRMADALGTDPVRTCDIIEAEMSQRCEALERDLAP